MGHEDFTLGLGVGAFCALVGLIIFMLHQLVIV